MLRLGGLGGGPQKLGEGSLVCSKGALPAPSPFSEASWHLQGPPWSHVPRGSVGDTNLWVGTEAESQRTIFGAESG